MAVRGDADGCGGEADFNLIPNGSGAADQIQNLLGGHVDAIIVTPAEAGPYVESGDFRLLAVANSERNDVFPDVPTFAEEGYDISVGTWRGLMVPVDTPADVIASLDVLFTQVYQSDDMQAFLETMGFGKGYLNSEDFTKLCQEQTEKYEPIISNYK